MNTNTMAMTVSGQTQSAKLAELRKQGFFAEKNLKNGSVNMRPISRVAFRKLHQLTNSQAKKQYAATLAAFRPIAIADFAANAATMDFAGVCESSSGMRTYKLRPSAEIAVARELTHDELLAQTAKSLGVTVEVLKALKA